MKESNQKLLYLLVPTRANFVFMMFAPLAVTFVSPAINMCTIDSTEGGALRVDEELRVASSMAADCKVCTHPHHFSFHHSSQFLPFGICYILDQRQNFPGFHTSRLPCSRDTFRACVFQSTNPERQANRRHSLITLRENSPPCWPRKWREKRSMLTCLPPFSPAWRG